MSARLSAVLAVALAAPARAGTARVEVVPELGNLGASPSVVSPLGAVPLQLASNSLVPLTGLSPAPLAVPFAAPALAVPLPAAVKPAVAEPRPLLIKSLAAPALDVSKLASGDAAGAAEADFNARAQLGAPAALGDGVFSAPAAAGRGSFLRLLSPARKPAKAAAGKLAAVEDAPTLEGLRALAEGGESRLLLLAPDGRWRLVPRAGAATAYPTPEEVEAAAGEAGRFFVVSKAGVVEWNATVPAGAGAALRSGLSALASRIPGLYPLVLAREGVAVRRTPWRKAVAEGLGAGEAPVNEHVLVARTIPALAAAEFPVIAAKLGRGVDAAYKADVLGRTNGYRMYWHSATTYKDHPDHIGIPDGHFRSDFGIRLMVKPDWRRLPDLAANYRPLFSHEYVHWLQDEGFVSTKYGAEIAAVAVEVLRAVELVGLDEVRAGRAGTVHAGIMSSFDGGRAWARGGFGGEGAPYLKGTLAGAAYEAAAVTGRPEAAWEFLNLVIAGKGALEPAAAWARVTGAR
ncbi:MAG: hypothetical protein HYX59_02190 [Elusimicrobia bacterium]|nr:hypothetical protein [Elusimicrobiota bacterium]